VEISYYLARIILHMDNNVNLKWARGIWRRLSKVLVTTRVMAPVAGMFYQDVVDAIFVYGSKSRSLSHRL
jgi:hypothetical protein